MKKIAVDIGCGTRKVKGAIGIDRINHPGVDILCDLEYSLPLKSASVDVFHAIHILEHVHNLIPFMDEIYRVCKPGAQVVITAPYFTSRGAFRDPTHVRYLSEETFMFFQGPVAPYGIKTNFIIQKVQFKYKPFFRCFPKWLRNIFRKHLWNVCDEFTVILQAQETPL